MEWGENNMTGIHAADKTELREIRRLLGEYGLLRVDQLVAYFHYKEESVVRGMLGYLSRNEYISKDDTHAAINRQTLEKGPDRQLIAAFWVFLSHRKKAEYDSRSTYPALLYFFAEGKEYEIVYAAIGDENRISAVLTRKEDDIHYLVIVERPEQIADISIPSAQWFYTVEPDGALKKYVQED